MQPGVEGKEEGKGWASACLLLLLNPTLALRVALACDGSQASGAEISQPLEICVCASKHRPTDSCNGATAVVSGEDTTIARGIRGIQLQCYWDASDGVIFGWHYFAPQFCSKFVSFPVFAVLHLPHPK